MKPATQPSFALERPRDVDAETAAHIAAMRRRGQDELADRVEAAWKARRWP